jgi:hypothetical protein
VLRAKTSRPYLRRRFFVPCGRLEADFPKENLPVDSSLGLRLSLFRTAIRWMLFIEANRASRCNLRLQGPHFVWRTD